MAKTPKPSSSAPNPLFAQAVQHHLAGRIDQAEPLYLQILQAEPRNAEVLHNLGEITYRRGKAIEALTIVERAIQIDANQSTYHNTRAVILHTLGRDKECYDECQRALLLDPKFANAWTNLGISMVAMNDVYRAIQAFEKAIFLDPNNPYAHDGLGMALLTSGEIRRGFYEQEWRWTNPQFQRQRFPSAPHWDGTDPRGKKLFIYLEQGFGDALQFCRYAPLLAQNGVRIILETAPELEGLLGRLPGITQFVRLGNAPPAFDFACPMRSLPYRCGTTLQNIPAAKSYLQASPDLVESWRPILQSDPDLKVGICWAGRRSHANDRHRSTTLDMFATLFDVPGVSFYSLQREQGMLRMQLDRPLLDLSPRLDTFDTTAAIVAQLELVISVDTALVHLAGAMGTPVWNLLPFAADWRWMLNRTDSPWYPTMRLFRQAKVGDWPAVFSQVKTDLKHIAQQRAHVRAERRRQALSIH